MKESFGASGMGFGRCVESRVSKLETLGEVRIIVRVQVSEEQDDLIQVRVWFSLTMHTS